MPYQRDVDDLAHKLVHDKRTNFNTDYEIAERRRAQGRNAAPDEPVFDRKTDYGALDDQGRAKFDAWFDAEQRRVVKERIEQPRAMITDEEAEAIDEQLMRMFPNDPKRQWEADLGRRGNKF